MRRALAIGVLLTLVVAACGGDKIADGAALIGVLESAGFSVQQSEGNLAGSPFTMIHDPFSHTVTNLSVDSRRLTIHEFPDVETANQAAAVVSRDGSGVAGSQFEWIDTPHFWLFGRVIVLYLGEDQSFIEELSSIVGSSFAGG